MANLTASRDTKSMITGYDMFGEFPLATGAIIFQGGAVGFDSTGKLNKASTAGNIAPAGRAQMSSNPAGALAGDLLKFHLGLHLWDNSGTNALTIANRYAKCYFEDDHTVGSLATGHLYGGTVWDVTTSGVWVLTVPLGGFI